MPEPLAQAVLPLPVSFAHGARRHSPRTKEAFIDAFAQAAVGPHRRDFRAPQSQQPRIGRWHEEALLIERRLFRAGISGNRSGPSWSMNTRTLRRPRSAA